MVKRHKRSLTLAALVLLLAQVFLMTFCNITAIAVTKEESSGSLFDNEFGNASVSYEETSTERLKWTVHLTKATQETATRFMVEVTGDGQAVTPENVQVLTKSNPTMNFAAGNGAGQITAGMSETAATTTGSAVITFDTNRSYTAMTVKPKLIADVNPATDLLAGNTGKSFTIPQVATSESTSENSAVAASEAPVSESSATEATSSTEVAVSETTSSTEQEATTDSTEATEEADVEDEVSASSDVRANTNVGVIPTITDITSLQFEKTWKFPEGVDPASLPPVTINIMQGDKVYGTEEIKCPTEPDANGNYVTIRDWKNLPIVKDGDKVLEYTIQEVPSDYYEEGTPVITESAIDSITCEPSCNDVNWDVSPTFVITRQIKNGPFFIWTLNHLDTGDRAAFVESVITAAKELGEYDQPLKALDGLSASDLNNNVIWAEGPDASATINGETVTVEVVFNDDGTISSSQLKFGDTSAWTHFATGGYLDLSQYLGHILVETVTPFFLLLTLQTPEGLDSESSCEFDSGY
ncbi:Cna B-type domain-containing protein, partial [Enterococcus asini]